jgi:hypothetical protein
VSNKKKKGYEICNLLQKQKKNYIKLLRCSKIKAQTYKRALGKGRPRKDSIE